MTFTPKNWQDAPSTATPLSASSMTDLETRLAAYSDARTNTVINVKDAAYGALGNGTTDDTVAVQAAITALGVNGGTVVFPPGNYKTTSPLLISVSGTRLVGLGRAASIISNTVSDVFTIGNASDLSYLLFEGFAVNTGGSTGHIFKLAKGMSQSIFRELKVYLSNTAKSIMQANDAGPVIDNEFRNCEFQHVANATVPGFNFVATSGANVVNRNLWQSCRCVYSGNYFFWLECNSSGTYFYDNSFRDITGEILCGGFAKVKSGQNTLFDNVCNYDMSAQGASTADWISIDKATSGPPSVGTIIRGGGRRSGSLGGGLYDIKLVANNCGRTIIEQTDSATLTGFSIDGGANGGMTLIGHNVYTLDNPGADFRAPVDRHRRQAGAYVPDVPGTFNGTYTMVANEARYGRFVVSRPMTITKIAFNLVTLAGSNDNVDVGIYDSAGAKVVTSGATASKLNAGGGATTVTVATTRIQPGVYYLAIACGTIGTTAAVLGAASISTSNNGVLFGAALGTGELGFMATAHPLPNNITWSSVNTVAWMAIRES